MTFSPTEEQDRALDLFEKGDPLKIDAYAGTGKTTTLVYLARSRSAPGCYLAFNRSIASEAKSKFPENVKCITLHALARRNIPSAHNYSDTKLTTSANANLISEVLRLSAIGPPGASRKFTISKRSHGAVLRDACRRFLYSPDPEPLAKHVPRYGRLAELSSAEFDSFAEEVLPNLRALWSNMRSPSGQIPLGHDGYLKLWALSRPRISADYIMLDEAQDSNPVILRVLEEQDSQVVYVGDPYQQVYEWRGAVNAMKCVHTPNRTSLTQSFRFGPSIAEAASRVIALLGAPDPIRGAPNKHSDICAVYPRAILCRTNAGVISHAIRSLAAGKRCHILGGTGDLQRLLQDVQRLKNGVPGELPEFFGFVHWDDVVAFSELPEGQELQTFIRLVHKHGQDRLLTAIQQCETDETAAAVTISTTHKAKGKEWDRVAIDLDFEPLFKKSVSSEADKKGLEAAARLLYVAITRACLAVEPPPTIMARFGLQNTRRDRVGAQPVQIAKRPGFWHLIRSIFNTR